jgi:hypothetical protein
MQAARASREARQGDIERPRQGRLDSSGDGLLCLVDCRTDRATLFSG